MPHPDPDAHRRRARRHPGARERAPTPSATRRRVSSSRCSVATRSASAHIVSAIFTATPDLTADFPAHAARRLGWTDVPLLGATEVDVPGALPRVVRVLLTVEIAVDDARTRLAPVYLDGAEAAAAGSRAQGAGGAQPKRTPAWP